ncbi:MAG: HEWD family protein [Halobellus sp.]|uniref:HEWD family protein n=1 Tax=Halobellus sp. TaxID=1979212 RepID=UPI0035D50C98
MTPTLKSPTERTCERCGRIEVWNEDDATWRLAGEDRGTERTVGSPYCIHEWDINGSFVPFEDESHAATA